MKSQKSAEGKSQDGKPREKSPRRAFKASQASGVVVVNDPSWGAALKSLMDAQGVSQAELSRRTGINQDTVSKIVRGERMGNMPTWRRLAWGIGCTVGEIEEAARNA